jgi:hypothetical protein
MPLFPFAAFDRSAGGDAEVTWILPPAPPTPSIPGQGAGRRSSSHFPCHSFPFLHRRRIFLILRAIHFNSSIMRRLKPRNTSSGSCPGSVRIARRSSLQSRLRFRKIRHQLPLHRLELGAAKLLPAGLTAICRWLQGPSRFPHATFPSSKWGRSSHINIFHFAARRM